jgi:hypothetical protein
LNKWEIPGLLVNLNNKKPNTFRAYNTDNPNNDAQKIPPVRKISPMNQFTFIKLPLKSPFLPTDIISPYVWHIHFFFWP